MLLFTYAVLGKAFSPGAFLHDMLNQPFALWFRQVLVWAVPLVEVVLVLLLVFGRTRRLGLWGCMVLLLLFTVYAGLILLGVFPYVPCGCGGVIRFLSWPQHLVFNGVFLMLSGLSLLWGRKRGD